jgi:hypothetical protein
MRSVYFHRVLTSIACAIAAAIIALMPSAGAAHAPDAQEIALGSLVDAELAFARMSVQRGIREAFLGNFADDGIVFEPAPVRLLETWSARPAPSDPLASRLEWKPAQAGVSRSGDMGYTTGPYVLTSTSQAESVRHGVFFSVWQRKGSRKWQVMLDAGIATPGAVDFAALGAAPRPHFSGRPKVAAERRALLDREAGTAIPGTAGFTPTRYAQMLTADARLHRNGVSPIAARGEVAAEVARRMSRVTWTPIDARVAAAADMAVTYGRYDEVDHAGQARDGYYAHLWLRDATGVWRLAYDIALPVTPP